MSTINKTIALDGSGNYTSIQAAFTDCLNDGNDYVLTIMDFGPYITNATLAARGTGGTVTLKANTFNRFNRPVLTRSGADGAIMTLNANHIIKGIKFVYDEQAQGAAFRYCIKSNLAGISSEVSHCQFFMGQRYHYDTPPPTNEFGHVGYWAEFNTASVKVWNCLFRGCAYAGVRYDPKVGNSIKIFHNDFVKCEECIWIEKRVTGVQAIHDNIFDLDGTYSPDCWKFSAIYLNTSGTPTQVGGLDYNLYYNRATGTRLPPQGTPTVLEAFVSFDVSKATRAAIVAAYPTQEVHGYDHDPGFYTYCQDYHPTATSFALAKASAIETVTDDNDGLTRPVSKAIGCFEVAIREIATLPPIAATIDDLANATLWAKATRVSGSAPSCDVTLKGVRLA